MRKYFKIAWSAFLPCALLSCALAPPAPTEDGLLLQKTDLAYIGAFRVPQGAAGADPAMSGYSYGGIGLAYRPETGTLLMGGHVIKQLIGEISIPELVVSERLADLKTAVVVQGLADITDGKRDLICEGGGDYEGDSGGRRSRG